MGKTGKFATEEENEKLSNGQRHETIDSKSKGCKKIKGQKKI